MDVPESSVAEELHSWVRDKFLELWRLAQINRPSEDAAGLAGAQLTAGGLSTYDHRTASPAVESGSSS